MNTEQQDPAGQKSVSEVEVEFLRRRIAEMELEMQQQQEGALLYLAAIVERAVGVGNTMLLSELDMVKACNLVLERGEPIDGGMAVRVRRKLPTEAKAEPVIAEFKPVLAKATPKIVLLDPSGQPNQ